MLGLPEFIFLLGGLLLLFGPSKLPELAQSLGEATKKFQDGMTTAKDNIKEKALPNKQLTQDENQLFKYADELNIDTSGKSEYEIAEEILQKTS